jgi:hypothetical protein
MRRTGWTADRLGRCFLILIAGLGVVAFLSVLAPFRRGTEAPDQRLQASWLPVARGQICFLGQWEVFKVLRDWENPLRFRVEAREAAFESSDLEGVLRTFLRERLAALHLDEPLRIQLVEALSPLYRDVPAMELGGGRLDWSFALSELNRGAEVWYLAAMVPPPCEGPGAEKAPPGGGKDASGRAVEVLSARSTEDLKEKLAREIARELLSSLPSM